MLVVGALAAAVALAPFVLTAIGMHARGHGVPVSVLAGLAFPLTWVVWYVLDEEPYGARR